MNRDFEKNAANAGGVDSPTPAKVSRRTAIKGAGLLAVVAAGGLGGALAYRKFHTPSPVEGPNVPAVRPSMSVTSTYIPILDCVPLIVAYEKGFFKDYGLKADRPQLIRTWPAQLEAFTSKQVVLTHILLPEVIFLKYSRNVNVRSIAFNHTEVVAMLRAKGIGSVKELGGKVVGCPTWWAPHTGIFQDVVRAAGLRPVVGKEKSQLADDEVAFRVIAPPDMVEGLKSGAIAGCSVSEPFGAVAEKMAGATMVKMSGDVWKSHPCCQSVLLQETIDKDRSWAQAVTKAIYQAAKWARENRTELATMLGPDGGKYFSVPTAAILRALTDVNPATYGPQGNGAIMHSLWAVKRVDFVPYPFRSAFATTLDLMRRTVVDPSVALPPALQALRGDKVADEIVDYDLVKAGMAAVGGLPAYNLPSDQRQEEYDVKLKEAAK